MKFAVDLTLVVEADNIADAFRAAIGGSGRVDAAGIRPLQLFAEVAVQPDIHGPRPEPEVEPEEEEEEAAAPAAKKKPGRKKKAVAKKTPVLKLVQPEAVEGELVVSKEQLVDAARRYMSQFGGAKTRELLKEFGAQQLRDVEEARWPEVFTKLQAGLEGVA